MRENERYDMQWGSTSESRATAKMDGDGVLYYKTVDMVNKPDCG